jgi:hypothetical protein
VAGAGKSGVGFLGQERACARPGDLLSLVGQQRRRAA